MRDTDTMPIPKPNTQPSDASGADADTQLLPISDGADSRSPAPVSDGSNGPDGPDDTDSTRLDIPSVPPATRVPAAAAAKPSQNRGLKAAVVVMTALALLASGWAGVATMETQRLQENVVAAEASAASGESQIADLEDSLNTGLVNQIEGQVSLLQQTLFDLEAQLGPDLDTGSTQYAAAQGQISEAQSALDELTAVVNDKGSASDISRAFEQASAQVNEAQNVLVELVATTVDSVGAASQDDDKAADAADKDKDDDKDSDSKKKND